MKKKTKMRTMERMSAWLSPYIPHSGPPRCPQEPQEQQVNLE